MLFRNKKEWSIDAWNNLNEYKRQHAEMKLISRGYIFFDSLCKLHFKRQNYFDRKQISGCQGLGIVGIYAYSGTVEGTLGVEGSDRRVLCPDCDGSYMNLYMC